MILGMDPPSPSCGYFWRSPVGVCDAIYKESDISILSGAARDFHDKARNPVKDGTDDHLVLMHPSILQ